MNCSNNTTAITRRTVGKGLLAVASVIVAPPTAWAQTKEVFPSRSVSLVVPMSPGGSTDQMARSLAQRLTKTLGQPTVVENKAGATGAIAANFVARASGDGHTLLMAPSSVVVVNPLVSNVQYDIKRDFRPVGLFAVVETIIVASKKTGFQTLADVISFAKKNPGKLTFGSNGIGSSFHLAGEFLQLLAGVELLHVPYKGAAPAEAALLANEIDIAVTNTVSILPHIKSGAVTPIAILSSSRSPSRGLPQVPHASATLPGYVVDTWAGLYAPASTSTEVILRLNTELNKFLLDPDSAEYLRTKGVEPAPGTPDDLVQFQEKELAKWAKVVTAAKAAGRL